MKKILRGFKEGWDLWCYRNWIAAHGMPPKSDEVTTSDVLNAIHIWHEVLAIGEEYPAFIMGHPHIELHADGSGSVVNLRDRLMNRNDDGTLFRFTSLKQLVEKSKSLATRYKLNWR